MVLCHKVKTERKKGLVRLGGEEKSLSLFGVERNQVVGKGQRFRLSNAKSGHRQQDRQTEPSAYACDLRAVSGPLVRRCKLPGVSHAIPPSAGSPCPRHGISPFCRAIGNVTHSRGWGD